MAHIVHIITGLNEGGAETVLFRLCLNDCSNRHSVISLTGYGKYGNDLIEKGVSVFCLNMEKKISSVFALLRLYSYLRFLKPDVVQTWMYHADLFGGVVARLVGVKSLYWGVRNSNLVRGKSNFFTILIVKICSMLSHWIPKKIICCAESARKLHQDFGYKKEKMLVINNGYDLDLFSPSDKFKDFLRERFSIPSSTVILGTVARFDPQKDHENLLKALALVKKNGLDFKFIFVGTGMVVENNLLMKWVVDNNVSENILFFGPCKEVEKVMNGIDIHVLPSLYGEAFPNVVAEAMACGTPCVVTDVGDAASIVGDTGWVVPPGQPDLLSKAIISAINSVSDFNGWEHRKFAAYQRVFFNYSISGMVEKYNIAWRG